MSHGGGGKLTVVMASVAVIVAVTLAMSAAQSSYREVESWTQRPFLRGDIEWEIARVATDAEGSTIYAFRRFDPPILEFDASGKIRKMWGENMFVWPHGLHIDPDGFLWVTDATIGPGGGRPPSWRRCCPRSAKDMAIRCSSSVRMGTCC